MIVAYLILIFSVALLFFYLQSLTQRVLRREFNQEFFQGIVKANRLGFPHIREAMEELNAPVEYVRFRTALMCDYLTLTYMLKNAANETKRFTGEERLLMVYFRLLLFAFFLRHALKLGEKPVVLRMTSVLRYFANVIGQRASRLRFANLSASEYLQNI